jgi:hypothetical protein
MQDFISEDDLDTFEGWLRYQAVDPTTVTADELANWRSLFDEARACPGLPAHLWSRLNGRLWHPTDMSGLKGIIGDGFIRLGDRYLNAFCRCRGSVSLFDFGPAASDQSEFEFANWFGWFGSEQNAPYSIWLEIDHKRSTDRLMNPAAVRDACRAAPDKTTLGKLHASPTHAVAPATVIDLDDPSFGGKFNGTTHINMMGTNNLAVFDVIQTWLNQNVPNPIVATSCPSGNGQGNNGL